MTHSLSKNKDLKVAVLKYKCLPEAITDEHGYELLPVQPADIESIRRWRNAQMSVLRQHQEILPDEQVEYFTRTIWPLMDNDSPDTILLSLLSKGTMIGYGGLVHIAWGDRRAEISFLVDPARACHQDTYHRDFTAYLSLIQRIAFSHLALNRLFTETYAFRSEHIKTLESCGLQLEGRLREHVLIKNRPTDSLIHGILRQDYETR